LPLLEGKFAILGGERNSFFILGGKQMYKILEKKIGTGFKWKIGLGWGKIGEVEK